MKDTIFLTETANGYDLIYSAAENRYFFEKGDEIAAAERTPRLAIDSMFMALLRATNIVKNMGQSDMDHSLDHLLVMATHYRYLIIKFYPEEFSANPATLEELEREAYAVAEVWESKGGFHGKLVAAIKSGNYRQLIALRKATYIEWMQAVYEFQERQ